MSRASKYIFLNLSHSSFSELKGKEKMNEFMKMGLVV